MSTVPNPLADKDFLTASREDQHKYLSAVDPDYAKASPVDQQAYHQQVVLPAVMANSKQMNAQPTQFEKERTSGSDRGFLSHVGQSIKSMIPEPPKTIGEAASAGLKASTGLLTPIIGAGKESIAASERGHGLPYSTAAGLSTLAGANPERMEAAANKGDTGGVLGEAAVPTAMALAPIGAEAGARAAVPALRAVHSPLTMTAEEALTKGISPRARATGFQESLPRAMEDLKQYHKETPINSVQELHEAIPEIQKRIWKEEVEPALKRQGSNQVDMKPTAEAVRQQISPEMKDFDPAGAKELEAMAEKLEGARDVTGANRLLKYVNGKLESYFSKYPSARKSDLMSNPETAGWEAARRSLREQFLQTLEVAGETGVRDARQRWGALEDVGKEVERRVNVADRAKPMSLGRILGLMGAIKSGGLSLVAGEVATHLNKPDVLVRMGLNRIPEAGGTAIKSLPLEAAPVATSGAAGALSSQARKRQLQPIPAS